MGNLYSQMWLVEEESYTVQQMAIWQWSNLLPIKSGTVCGMKYSAIDHWLSFQVGVDGMTLSSPWGIGWG